MLLLLDNYDSFTYNLYQYLSELGEQVEVYRNDKLTVAEVEALQPDRIVISPGPCTPNEAGISMELIQHMAGKVPVLGVCLGHQSMGQVFGGKVVRAGRLMHGKTSPIHHDGKGLFEACPTPSRRCGTIRCWWRRQVCRTAWRSRPRATRARSWACATGSMWSRASSSTPSRS